MKYIDYIEFRQAGKCMYAWLGYEAPLGKVVELFGVVRYRNSPLPCPFVSVSHLSMSCLTNGRYKWAIRITFHKQVTEHLVIDVALKDGRPVMESVGIAQEVGHRRLCRK